ncbi:MAG TPA: ATPase, T2SS/T4P/T4SS family, partial [Planctomycetaceae bacterium]|nr:ATPase, T2SS/T4P/T4SS family [Planctomycetaceae bacterium]
MSPMSSRTLQVSPETEGANIDPDELKFQRLKVAIHEKLVDSLDLSILAQVRQDQLEREVRLVAEDIVREEAPQLTGPMRERMLDELYDEVFGLGPLEALMRDDRVCDILVNKPYEVYVERYGRLEPSNVIFADDAHLLRIIQRVVSRVGRRIDEVSPMVDARLPDGSRVNAVIPPLALDGATLSIRRFGARPLGVEDLVDNQTIVRDMTEFLAAAVEAR